MKKLIRLGQLMATVVVCLFVALQFTSCSPDETKDSDIYYSMGFNTINSNNFELFKEMSLVENTFKKTLNVTDNTFFLKGTTEKSDTQVKTACEKAEEELKDKKWSFDGEFNVTRRNPNSVVVYTYNIVKAK